MVNGLRGYKRSPWGTKSGGTDGYVRAEVRSNRSIAQIQSDFVSLRQQGVGRRALELSTFNQGRKLLERIDDPLERFGPIGHTDHSTRRGQSGRERLRPIHV